MLADLAALTPPLIVGLAFLIAVALFLRKQMSASRQPEDDRDEAEISDDGRNADPGDPAEGPSAGQHKV